MASELVASSTARRIPIAFSKKNSFSKEAFSGTLAGWAQVVVGFPFDTIKVRLQTDSQKYKTAINCLKMTIRQETALGLYKGSSSPMLGNAISNAILFSTNKKFRGMFNDGDPTHSLTLNEIAKAGALTGVVMSLVNCPIELLKVKLQTQYDQPAANKKYTSVFHAASSIYNQNNIKGLYRGITATVIRDVPTKKLISDRNHRGDLNKLTYLELLMAGGTAGAINSNKSILGVFTKGLAPTMARAFPANAATFFAYEKSKELFREK
nr:11958_t:CDS:2 [Entrophospora candida]